MANIWIENHGVFTVSNDKVQDLLSWLSNNQAVQAEGKSEDFKGEQLLNEKGPHQQSGNVPPTSLDERPPNNPEKTWDMGTKWI